MKKCNHMQDDYLWKHKIYKLMLKYKIERVKKK